MHYVLPVMVINVSSELLLVELRELDFFGRVPGAPLLAIAFYK